jgi:hypothetical protein
MLRDLLSRFEHAAGRATASLNLGKHPSASPWSLPVGEPIGESFNSLDGESNRLFILGLFIRRQRCSFLFESSRSAFGEVDRLGLFKGGVGCVEGAECGREPPLLSRAGRRITCTAGDGALLLGELIGDLVIGGPAVKLLAKPLEAEPYLKAGARQRIA